MLKKTFAASAIVAAASGVILAGTPAFADDWNTSGNGSILGGNQVGVDVDVPINVCGNAIAVLGNAGANCEDSNAIAAEVDDNHVWKW
ncbi:chaplin family protein [Marinitenerispora sediminis]|uniref:DUF320 domain-containing protein n=1 Tax=Marinitenerispora sediminis TaxID=1931232 RepID=A0A368T5K0_9ACTN|nr:chaplin family protein [Marinitenerispora sediminis]RCV55154.1 DUF320 domain-containing protein [Marinitenerispora sediminis]RCV58947.1 DUF320 domain-containing protein [Marinitenerispora sediminis]RCV61511.1 DUF320 domain-containing protein [Marinitenerispora sediminis]